MSSHIRPAARVPRHVSLFSPVLRRLLALGIPLGPNALITIRGRTSGLARTTPLAIIEIAGRRWVWAPWGDVHWVRNLRAAGRAEITVRRRTAEVTTTELGDDERVVWFRDTFGPFTRSIPGGALFVRVIDQVDLGDPVAAANGRVVFELHEAA